LLNARLPAVLVPVLAAAAAFGSAPAGAAAPLPPPPAEVAGIPVSLLVDLGSGRVLHARQPGLRFVPASMAKVMTLHVALEERAKGRLPADCRVTVAGATARQWDGQGTSLYLKGGESVTVDDLLRGIATVSANDASVVLAESHAGSVAGWTGLMNAEARRLGMDDSHFATPSGWPDGGATYVSARDLVTLAEALIARHPAEYRRYFGQKRMVWRGVTLQSHDPTVGVVRGADGIKTGHTNEAGYNFLGSAEREGRRLVMVVAGARTAAERAAASRALLEWGFSAWEARPLFASGGKVAEARVQGGSARRVALVADRQIDAVMPKGAAEPVALRLVYRGPLLAPVAKGAEVARLEIRVGDGPVTHMPLRTAESVGVAGPLDRLLNGLRGLFS
jgi:D-alanyl-D-alanine carboxypeptidase (penicillin-binding protein 5/6)